MKCEFGITLDDYNVMVERQRGVCAICQMPENGKSLAVDHDHKTGIVRGLLCANCNNGLGRFKDNINVLLAAIHYLDGSNSSL